MRFWRRKRFVENGSKLLEQLIVDCNGISNPIRRFSFDQISKAKKHFDPEFFTCVIKGRSYAIKKYAWFKEQGYMDIVLSARVSNHSGFLKLIGCCLDLKLPVGVFENPEHGVLNKRGSVGRDDAPLLAWNVRLKIAKEVAIAVTYLHTAFPRITIHMDIKPTNVYLDKNWNAKLSGFSIAVTLPEGKTFTEVDAVKGTIGYMDPTYMSARMCSEYTDVFSFGIFMLVLLLGIPAFDLQRICEGSERIHILGYVKDLQERGEPIEFGGETDDMRPAQMNMFFELALRCCAERNEDRPKMIMVAKELKLIEKSLASNVLETGSDTVEVEEKVEPLAIESRGVEQPLDLHTTWSLDSWSNRSYRGFIILGFVFCFVVVALFIGNQLHTVINVTQMCKA